MKLWATEACTERIMYAKNWLCQRVLKGDMEDCFVFDSWFSSNKLAESSMDVGK